jgi:hypothetical protein
MGSDRTGVNLVLAIRDFALAEAEELEATAQELKVRAVQMESQADVLRRIHAVAAPHFPKVTVRMLNEATGT